MPGGRGPLEVYVWFLCFRDSSWASSNEGLGPPSTEALKGLGQFFTTPNPELRTVLGISPRVTRIKGDPV